MPKRKLDQGGISMGMMHVGLDLDACPCRDRSIEIEYESHTRGTERGQ